MPLPVATLAFRVLVTLTFALASLTAAQEPSAAAAGSAAAAPADNPMRHYLNTVSLEWLRHSWAAHGLTATEIGHGRVRMLAIGGPEPEFDHAIAQGEVCLDGLELITGNHNTFTTPSPAPGEIFYVVMYQTQDQCRQLVDDLRAAKHLPPPATPDLMREHPNFPMSRVLIVSLENSRPILDETCVYGVACLCMDGFFISRKGPKARPPTWLREGLAADMQQLICKRITCTTIAYEDKTFPRSDNWNHDVKALQASGSNLNKSPHELMALGLDALPNVFYEQMYSLERYVRTCCGVQKASKPSKLLQLLEALAQDESGIEAIHHVLGRSERQFTDGWVAWVAEQR